VRLKKIGNLNMKYSYTQLMVRLSIRLILIVCQISISTFSQGKAVLQDARTVSDSAAALFVQMRTGDDSDRMMAAMRTGADAGEMVCPTCQLPC
jgi:hypothetical protein